MQLNLRKALVLAGVVLLVLAVPVLVITFAAKTGFWQDFTIWVYGRQRDWQQSVSGSLGSLSGAFSLSAAWGLIAASFLYGFFHAVGPGHGKVIMTTYLLANPQEVKRGMTLSVVAALCQGVVAIVLVYGLLFVAGFVAKETKSTLLWSERASYTLVAIMGFWLLWRAVATVVALKTQFGDQHIHDHNCRHGHSCGHSHGVTSDQLTQQKGLRTSVGIVLSIGLRPCTGAVLVLILAKSLGLALVGVVAVIGMSFGTALAITSLALLTIWSRRLAVRWVDGDGLRSWLWVSPLISAFGGLVLVLVGYLLMIGSFAIRSPLGIS
ncbi:nickel/cobalt transporter [Alphaproteobacteria bacterium]|nr:nickel/cobalt transporter [Alphaproteobacteria bacterium]